jgi:hypothetical protein
MNDLKSVYYFDNDRQFLKIEFLTDSEQLHWKAYVFDENWNDTISTAAAISDSLAESIEYATESIGIRGRMAVLADLKSGVSLSKMIDISLFHLQALLFSSAIIVNGDYDDLESFGFSKIKSNQVDSLYILSSEDMGNDACRFL